MATINNGYFGAQISWEDLKAEAARYGKRSDTDAFEFFMQDSRCSGRNLFIPSYLNGNQTIILLDRQIVKYRTEALGIQGPSFALGSTMPTIRFNHNSSFGLAFPTGGIRLLNLQFTRNTNANRSPVLAYLQIGGWGSSAGSNENDTDSSIKSCRFDNIVNRTNKSKTSERTSGIRYNGRNARIENCDFSDINDDGICIDLRWENIDEDAGEGNDGAVESSWRKNRVIGCQFHTARGAETAINIRGQHPIQGLLVSNNITDVGMPLLKLESGGIAGGAITGNTVFGRRSSRSSIELQGGIVRGLAITGNGFATHNNGNNRIRSFIYVRGGCNNQGIAVSGNSFYYSDSAAVQVDNVSSNRKNVCLSGNVFSDCDKAYDSGMTMGTNLVCG